MTDTRELPGQFLFLPPEAVQAGDVLMETIVFGPVATSPHLDVDGMVLLTIDGQVPVSVPGTNKVRLFRPDDPAAASTCACGAEPGERHDAIDCPLFDDLRHAARTIWHHLDEQERPVGWELPGVFQRLPYRELTSSDIVLESGRRGIFVDRFQGPVLISSNGSPHREPAEDVRVRIFRPADPEHAAACMDPERMPGGYGPPCWESHSTDFCLSLITLLDIAFQLWPGLQNERERAHEQRVALAQQRDAAFSAVVRASAIRLETEMKAIAGDIAATISTRDQRVQVAWRDGSVYSIDSALCPADDHDAPHEDSPAAMFISRQRPEGKSVTHNRIAAIPFPPRYAHDARIHAEFALAAITHDRDLLARQAPRQA
ncbi:hypothetical protein [Streptosporangium sp. CA-115845]|uniref:hypothetical protein n=1 Tax=Streptosporangium sp. CA-115845 TaxID=3240071 RepID=UPI003D93F89B